MTRTSAFLLAAIAMPALANQRAQSLADMCAACHGPGGVSSGLIPRLDDLEPAYIAAQLSAFRAGTREGTVMNLIARGLSDEDIDDIGSHVDRSHVDSHLPGAN